jgi:hypothetical protein
VSILSTPRIAFTFALGSVLVSLAGCEGCRGEKPYTPFGVTSALPAPPALNVSSSAPLVSPSAKPPEVLARKAVFAPKDATTFHIAGRDLASPKDRVFEQLLDADFDGDGKTEVVAWTLAAPDTEGQTPGELWLYSAAEPKKLLDFPAFVPTGSDCRHVTSLALQQARALILDISAICNTPRLARSPTRAFALVDPLADRGPRFGLRVADPAPGETLGLALTVGDEDNDARDDFRLAVTLALPNGEANVSAHLVWLDRAAGISRDTREPGRSLDALLQRELARAKQKKTAKAALARVETARRLLGSLCGEGKVPRLFDWEGSALRCAPLAAVVDRLAATEITAALTLSDVPLALSALLRDGWYFGAMSPKQKSALEKEVEKKLTRVPAAKIVLGARPRAAPPLGYSPLAFEPEGALLLQSESGLMRLLPDGAREEPVSSDSGVSAWPLQATTAQGATLLGVSYSCDRSEIALLLAGASSAMEPSSLLAPRPGVCGGQPFPERLAPSPVSSQDGVRIQIAGLELGAPRGPIPRGSARSPDGTLLAASTPLGLLVQKDGGTELWQIDGWDGGTGCVVANGGQRAACLRRGHAELYLKSAPATP